MICFEQLKDMIVLLKKKSSGKFAKNVIIFRYEMQRSILQLIGLIS